MAGGMREGRGVKRGAVEKREEEEEEEEEEKWMNEYERRKTLKENI